jgi:cell division ATPase FtsA
MSTQRLQQYIVLDIDSNSIGAMVIEKQKKDNRVMYYERTPIHGEKDLSFDDFFLKTQRLLAHLSEAMTSVLSGEYFEIYVNLSSPWVSSQKRILEYKRQKDFTFTKALAQDMIRQEIELPFSDNPDYHDYDAVTLMERRTLDVFINGYPTRKPYGEIAKTVELHALASVMSTETKQVFESIIERYFHRVPVFFSNTFMNYQSVKTVLPYEDNVIVVDISGRTTEVSVIKQDHLTHIASFPTGSDHIIRGLAERLSFSVHKTYSMIETLHDEILDQVYIKRIEGAMESSFQVWKQAFYNVMGVIAKDGVIPSQICLLTPPMVQEWLTQQLLSAEELTIHMHAGHTVSIIDMQKIFAQNSNIHLNVSDQNMLMIHNFIEQVYGTQKASL